MVVRWEKINQSRKWLSREQGTIIKDWGGKLPFALIYPNSYFLGMSSLGVQVIYGLLNRYPDVLCERAFCEGNNTSLTLSVESQRPLTDFAILAFSFSHELDYLNLAQMLKTNGIPLYSRDRDERYPLIIAGGPAIIANPAPLSAFFDCLAIGEAEALLPPLLATLRDNTQSTRPELLKKIAAVPGFYAPLFHTGKPVVRQWVQDLDKFPVHSTVLTRDTELGGLYLIEVERGCPWQCRFCLTCHAFSPMRNHSLESLLVQGKEGLKYRKRLGLLGADVADYPQLEELVLGLRKMGAELSTSSLRIKPLVPVLLGELAKGGSRTVVLAPEAGSQRLRDLIRKDIDEDDILKAMEWVATQKISQLKLYFMVGLPTETAEDIEEIIKLTLKCQSILERQKATSRITLNIAPFVPKAGTPFQWLPMAALDILNQRISHLKNNLSPKGIKLNLESPAWSEVQAVLSRGDSKLAEVVADIETQSLPSWRKAAKKHQLNIDYYAHQQWDIDTKLPWSIVESGIKTEYLKEELKRALRG